MSLRRFSAQLEHTPWVRTVSGPHSNREPHFSASVSPVRDIVFQQGAVGNEGFRSIPQLQHRRAEANFSYGAALAANFQYIAYTERALEKQDEPADEVFQQ